MSGLKAEPFNRLIFGETYFMKQEEKKLELNVAQITKIIELTIGKEVADVLLEKGSIGGNPKDQRTTFDLIEEAPGKHYAVGVFQAKAAGMDYSSFVAGIVAGIALQHCIERGEGSKLIEDAEAAITQLTAARESQTPQRTLN